MWKTRGGRKAERKGRRRVLKILKSNGDLEGENIDVILHFISQDINCCSHKDLESQDCSNRLGTKPQLCGD